MLILSSILITLALLFYSLGIWAERIARYLKGWHIVAFWAGFSFDLAGTFSMHMISNGKFDILSPHTLTGQIAIWLMLAHAIWATVVILKGTAKTRTGFHRYSIIVWSIWLIPYFSGMYLGMNK